MDVQKMSIEEKVGQLFMVGFHDPKPTGEVIHLITVYKIGGLCYFERNIRHPRQLHQLSTNLQLYAPIDLPLFIAIHQEGSDFNTIVEGVTQSPNPSSLGAVNNQLYTKQMAEIVATELHEIGINMNFSPHLRTTQLTEEARSFGGSPDLVAKHGAATIQGYQNKNVSAIATVFPGDEVADVNTLLTESFDYNNSSQYPFYHAIQKGVDALLISQTLIPHLHTNDPELYSTSILHKLLREQMQFTGVIMKKYQETEQAEELAHKTILALQAGVDLLVIPGPYRTIIRVIDTVIEAVKNGAIPEEHLNTAVNRILTLKKQRQIGQVKQFNRDNLRKKRSIQFVEQLNEQATSKI